MPDGQEGLRRTIAMTQLVIDSFSTSKGDLTMNDIQTASVPAASAPIAANRGRQRRWPVLAAAAGVTAVGLALGWDWLAAVGVAPVLLAAAPCLGMCALGLCMNRMGKRGVVPEQEGSAQPSVDASSCCAGKRDTTIQAS